MDVFRVKEEFNKAEFTLENNDNTRNQIHLIKRTPKVISSKPIQTEDMPLPKLSKLKAINNVKSQYKSLLKMPQQSATPTSILIQPANSEASTKTSIPCTSIVPSCVTKIISKESAIETIQTKNSNNVIFKSVDSLNQVKPLKPRFKAFTSNSSKQMPGSSSAGSVHPLSGARFLQTQVHTNSVLQTLLKDIINLNNEKDDVDEEVISQEVARLRAKNNLPSLNADVKMSNLEFEDSDFSEGSDDESYNYYNPRISENYGKDSGYDNESQHSESLEEDNIIEKVNLRNAGEKSVVLAEPEYIDLDKYFGSNKRKLTVSRGSLVDIRTISKYSQQGDESIKSLNKSDGLTCAICNKTLMSKRSYRKHTKNGTGCIKNSSDERRLIFCKGTCKFYGTNEEFLIHKRQKHSIIGKTPVNKVPAPVTCRKCLKSFLSNLSFEEHYKTHHKKMICLFCNFACDNSTEYNLHISSKHSKRAKSDSTSSDSDCLQIIEIDNED